MFKSTIRMGNKCNISDFDCVMIVGARQGGSETAHLLEFSCTTGSLAENGAKNEKHSVSSSSVCRNALLMREVRGEGSDWYNRQEGDCNANNHALQQWYAEQDL